MIFEKRAVLAAIDRQGCMFLRGCWETTQEAVNALRRTIDSDALRVVDAEVCFAVNGNVRIWRSL